VFQDINLFICWPKFSRGLIFLHLNKNRSSPKKFGKLVWTFGARTTNRFNGFLFFSSICIELFSYYYLHFMEPATNLWKIWKEHKLYWNFFLTPFSRQRMWAIDRSWAWRSPPNRKISWWQSYLHLYTW